MEEIKREECSTCFKFKKDESTECDGYFFGICIESYEKELIPQDTWCTRWNVKDEIN